MKKTIISISFILAIALLIVSCKKDDDTVTPTILNQGSVAGMYVGTLAGVSSTGSLSFTIASSAKRSSVTDVNITGTLKVVGDTTITLNGIYKSASDSIYLSGGGYFFAGKLSAHSVSGDFTGPHGVGAFSVQKSVNGTAKVYIGSSTSQAGHSASTLNIVIDGSSLVGLAVSGSSKTYLNGTVVADSIIVHVVEFPDIVIATGRLNGSIASGTYATPDDHGDWFCTLVE